MEKPTYTAIDYNSKENKVIEERIRNYYLPVKNTFEAVLYGRLNIPDSPRGLCADLIDVSRTISREFALKGTLMVMVKLRDGGCLIFNFGMFSFMKRKVAKSEEFLERIGLRI